MPGEAGTPRETRPLSGRRIVVTRPLDQCAPLAAAIRALGGEALIFPVLSIAPVSDPERVAAVGARLGEFALAVFVSPNAIEHAFAALGACPWPAGLAVAAIGATSEQALAARGFSAVIAPRERQDSEALLALAPLQAEALRGRRVVVFRGDGGRELLGETLAARGARVEYVTCYHRSRPSPGAADLALWRDGAIDAVTLTSSEGLRNLWDLLDDAGRARLAGLPVLVPHARIAEEARRLGLARVTLTGPGDTGLAEGLARFRFEEAKCPH